MRTRVCGNCRYLDYGSRCTVGYECRRPGWIFRTPTAKWKQKWTSACRDFEKADEKPREDKGMDGFDKIVEELDKRGTLKAVCGDYVIYNRAWLQSHLDSEYTLQKSAKYMAETFVKDIGTAAGATKK